MTTSAPKTAKHIVTVTLKPGAQGGATDIALPTGVPDFDRSIANPILAIGHIKNQAAVAVSSYTAHDQVATHAACVGGTFFVGNTAGTFTSRTFQLGDAIFAKSQLIVAYQAAGDVKQT